MLKKQQKTHHTQPNKKKEETKMTKRQAFWMRPMRIKKERWQEFKQKAKTLGFTYADNSESMTSRGQNFYYTQVCKTVLLKILVPTDTKGKEEEWSKENTVGQIQIDRSGQINGPSTTSVAYLYEELEIVNSLFPLMAEGMLQNGS